MWRAFWAIGILAIGWVSCASAESLYLTTSFPLNPRYASDNSYIFIAPYFTRVQTQLSASITKVVASGNAANSGSKAASPLVLGAKPEADGEHITYVVSCDLTSVLFQSDPVSIDQIQPTDYGGTGTVADITSTSVVVKLAKKPSSSRYLRGGVISGASCPPPGDTFNVTLGVTPIPISRGFLYLHRNAFYNDTINVSVGNDGMLSSSNSASAQQITAILTELAQTIAPAVQGKAFAFTPSRPAGSSARSVQRHIRWVAYRATPIAGLLCRALPVAPRPAARTNPPPAIVDDKFDLPCGSAHDLPDIAERRGVKVEHRQTDEIAYSSRLRKTLQIVLVHRHRMLCVHHAGRRYHGLSARRERPRNHCAAEHCDQLTPSHPVVLPKAAPTICRDMSQNQQKRHAALCWRAPIFRYAETECGHLRNGY